MKVIVVDDEVFVRKGIMTSIPWHEHGIHVAGEAPNGQIGLELVRKIKPQVVLTDLRMPVMDGLEMIRRIRSEFSDIKIIILSVREDFQGVQEALRLGVVDYIHKLQLTPDNLLQCVLQIKASIGGWHDSSHSDSPSKADANAKLWHWLNDDSVSGVPHELADASNHLLVKMELHRKNSGDNVFDKSFLKALIHKLKLKSEWESSVWISDKESSIWIWLHSNDPIEMESVGKDLEIWLNAFSEEMDELPVSAGFSLPFYRIQDRLTAMKQAEQALELIFHAGSGFVHPFSARQPSAGKEPQPLFESQCLKKYLQFMELNEWDQAANQLDILFPMKIDIGISESYVREAVFQWLSPLVAVLRERFGYMHNGILDKSPFEYIAAIRTYSELREWCMRFHMVAQEMLQRMRSNQQRYEIRKAIDYIRENYTQPIRVQDVAQFVHLSENYFSYLFSKETGKPFIQYLQEIRVEQAKELIRKGESTWIDIGYATGFENPKYFSKIFKRYTGMTPSQFASLNR